MDVLTQSLIILSAWFILPIPLAVLIGKGIRFGMGADPESTQLVDQL